MIITNNLFTAILKAVCAPANNGGFFQRLKKRGPFNPKITLGINLN
jgi:hypothetical protein